MHTSHFFKIAPPLFQILATRLTRRYMPSEKYKPNAFKGNAGKKWNQNLKLVSAVFVRVAAPRIKSSLKSKPSRNLGNMAKIFFHALSILKKHMTEILGINFAWFCGTVAWQ